MADDAGNGDDAPSPPATLGSHPLRPEDEPRLRYDHRTDEDDDRPAA